MFALTLGIVFLVAPPSSPVSPPADRPAASQPAAGAATPVTATPEERLWNHILALRSEPAATQPYATWLDAVARQRQALQQKLRLYLTLYPGGAHRVDAVRLELATLHELGALRGGSFDPLCARVRDLLRDARPEDPATWEAAYWDIQCQRLAAATTTAPSTSASVLSPDNQLLAAYWEYVTRYPRSTYVPRMASALFDRALQAGDAARMQQLADSLARDFPDHAVTATLSAVVKRERAVGHPFWLTFDSAEGAALDTREFVGRPVLIVVWAACEPASCRRVAEVERFRETQPEVRVAGVSLDISRDAMAAACTELHVGWPQFNDGLGPANRFAREWGVTGVPHVFVIDRSGRLVGSTEGDDWKMLAEHALAADAP